ncbi:MAG: cobalamin B12-binding domain-containing protein [Chloroflexi bacterium]|nr:cobalamin B12-binding domain-containing protein [Chloroflexota bacterium]
MNVVTLIAPPICYQKDGQPIVLDATFPPLGLLYLAAAFERENISVSILDVGAKGLTLAETMAVLETDRPLVVGISAMTPVLQGAVQIAEEIKRTFGDAIRIALGGAHISADPRFIERFPCFDFAITGEGELTFPALVKRVLGGEKIQGLHRGEALQNLDDIPFPARHLLDQSDYQDKSAMIATRGCPFNCYFCSRPAVAKRVRHRSPQNIVTEMKSLCDLNGRYFQFQDDTLTVNRTFTLALCEEIVSQGLKVKWTANTRIDLVDEELVASLSRAGCYTLVFGIESGNQRVREQVIGKRFSNEQILKVMGWCRKYAIDVDGFFMIGHPTETEKEVRETVDFMQRSGFNIVGLSIPTPFPGSNLYEIALQAGVVSNDSIDRFARGELGQGYAGVYPVYVPDSMTREGLEDIRRKALRGFYLRPSYILRRLSKDFRSFSLLKRDLAEGLSYLIRGSSQRSPYRRSFSRRTEASGS